MFNVICNVTSTQNLDTRLDEACSEQYDRFPEHRRDFDAAKAAAKLLVAEVGSSVVVQVNGDRGSDGRVGISVIVYKQ